MAKSNQKLINRVKDVGLNPPEILTLLVTSGCNLHCRHCLLDCRSHTKIKPVPTEILLKRIAAFAALGGSRIIIAGGEPLCHPDWQGILEFCCNHTDFQEVYLQTNGTLLTPDRVRVLLDLPVDKLFIQVSLDGAGAVINDYVRGPGSYERTLDGIRQLAEFGLGERTRIAFTEMVHNFEDLTVLLEMVDRLGIGRLVSGTLLKGGRAAQNDRIAPPVPSQYRRLIDRYRNSDRFRNIYQKRGNIAAIEWHKGISSPGTQGNHVCTCIENLFIDANGWIYPCVMMPAKKYAVKIADDRHLDRLIIESLPLWAELPVIERNRRETLKKCRGCRGERHCAGGCMGRAYTIYGDLISVEDRCALRRAVYSYETMRCLTPRITSAGI